MSNRLLPNSAHGINHFWPLFGRNRDRSRQDYFEIALARRPETGTGVESGGYPGHADIFAELRPHCRYARYLGFVFQMTAFVERPEWKNTMGDFYPVVTGTLRNMNVQMERIIRSAAPKANVANVK